METRTLWADTENAHASDNENADSLQPSNGSMLKLLGPNKPIKGSEYSTSRDPRDANVMR